MPVLVKYAPGPDVAWLKLGTSSDVEPQTIEAVTLLFQLLSVEVVAIMKESWYADFTCSLK